MVKAYQTEYNCKLGRYYNHRNIFIPYNLNINYNFKELYCFICDVLRILLVYLQSGYALDFIRVFEFLTIRPVAQVFNLDSCKRYKLSLLTSGRTDVEKHLADCFHCSNRKQ